MSKTHYTITVLFFLLIGNLVSSNTFAQSEIILEDSINQVKPDTINIGDTLDSTQKQDSIIILDTLNIVESRTLLNLTDSSLILGDSASSWQDSLKVVYYTGSIENFKLNRFTYIDTNTYDCQNIGNPLLTDQKLYATLSNIGEASRNIVFTPILTEGFYTGLETFSPYMYNVKDVKYYRQFVPYTEINYSMGSKKEQNFNVIFSRHIFKGLIIGIDFALNFSPSNESPYSRSGSNDQRVCATAQYFTPNKRYGLIANFIHNNLKVLENGGITNDSLFENNFETDRRIIPVNLSSTENFIRTSGFFVEQYFNIISPKNKSGKLRKIDPGNVSYSVNYQTNKFLYTDEKGYSSFYYNNSVPIDSTYTYDSLYQSKFENTFKWSNLGYQDDPASKIFYMYLGISYSQFKQTLPQDSVVLSYSQTKTFGGIAFNFGKSFLLDADAYYITGNYNQGDYGLNGTLRQYLGNINRNIGYLKFNLNLISRMPNWYFNNYNSNLYRWSNNFNKENYLMISGSYNFKSFSTGVKFTTVGNYTYLNDSIRPEQLSKGETILQIFAEGKIPLNKFGIETRVFFQQTSQPNVIRVPNFTGIIDLYFRTPIFKKAGTIQTGFQITYFTEYYAYDYMPELRMFYLQNEKMIGNYPYADFYFTLMVKRARLFFKLSHFNSYFRNYSYYLTPHYPAQDAYFRFGISWRFHD